MRRFAERLRAEKGINLQVRIGANVGEVVVRSIQTGASHAEYTPIGHSTSLASRLQTLANPGSIAISESLRKLVEGYFTLKALGPARIKGSSELVNVYEVTGLGPLRTRLQRSAGRGLTKFVGREREMDALRHAAEHARHGRGQIVAVMAEPGVGKSRLFFEFKAVSQSGCMVLETFSVSHGKASAYLPVIDLLHGYFKITGEDDPRTRREKVNGRIVTLDPALEDSRPYLFALLGIVEGDDPLAQMDGQIKKRRTLEAIKRILLRESLNQPLMVFFEDLHWIDEQTQEFLNLLADSIGTAKVLLLVNYRPEYSHKWGNKTYYTQLRLAPLGQESAGEMLSTLFGDGDDLLPLKRLIIERTEGNPFFMEEMYQALIEQGVLVRNGAVKLAKPLGDIRVPLTVQAILASRIDRLPSDAKDLLQALAVIGREFSLSLVRAVVAKSEDELNRMLDDLQLAEFIYEQPAVGDAEYVFKHALTQEVAYNSVLLERRKLLHERAGEALESTFAGQLDDHLDELARHYHRSGNASKAVEYLHRAAQQAMSRSAYREAEEPLNTALALLATLPASIDRDRTESSLRLNLGICTIFNVPGAYMLAETLESLELARGLCEKFGKDALRCDILSALAFLYANRLESEKKVQTTCEELLEIATPMNDTDMIGRALFWSAFTPLWRGDFTAASERLERAYELPIGARSKQELSFGGWQTLTRSLGALTLLIAGHPEKAALRNQEALALARERKDHGSLIPTLFWSAFLNVLLRQPEAAYRHVEEGLRLAREESLAALVAVNAFWRSYTLVQLGQMEEGLAELARYGAEMVQFVRTPVGSIVFQALADGYLKARHPDQGLQAVAQELEIVQDIGTRFGEPEVHRLKGELLLLDGEATSEAEGCFREAIEIARHQGAKWWELRAAMSLARLLARTGRRAEARAILAEIYNWFTEGFDTLDLKEAKSLLDELDDWRSGSSPPSAKDRA